MTAPGAVVHVGHEERHADRLIADLASRQHGLVARRQLFSMGLGRGAIDWRIRTGRLHPVHRGVYMVGHRAKTANAWWMAAVLAGGDDAVLSHRSAAALHRIRQWARPSDDVTVPRALHRRGRIVWHRAALPDDEVTMTDGIPVTTPVRTIFDLAALLDRRQVERAMHEAEVRQLLDALSLRDLLARHPSARGAGTIEAILASKDCAFAYTRNDFEELFHSFLVDRGFPIPRFNVRIWLANRWIEADAVWDEERVIAELDGRAVHNSDRNFDGDRARDRRLQAIGWRVARITWRQLNDEPEEVEADLRDLLGL